MLLLPDYLYMNLGVGGLFSEIIHPKGIIHTTEGSSLAGAEKSFTAYPPHLGYDPVNRIKHQYISLDKHSFALRGDKNDAEYAIQVEIVGFASQSHLWSDQIYKNIAEDVIKPLEDVVKIPRVSLTFHGANEKIYPYISTKESPIRLTNNSYRLYTGWLGHQHVPSPDTHWDPGHFLIQKCFNHLNSLVTSIDWDTDMSVRLQRGDSQALDPNGVPWGHYVYMVKYDPELPQGAVRKYMEDGPIYRSLKTAQGGVDVLPQTDLDAIPVITDPQPQTNR